ncbi:MAG TPA: LapA family protein [Chloroflexota bacterium]|nr:LapA family protein [Chloroflexota bacterium]
MSSPTLFAALVLATAAVVFGAQNTQAVTFHFLVFKVPSVPLVLPLFGAVLLGALLGWVVSVPGRFRRMRQRRGLQSEVAAHKRSDAVVSDASQSPVG